MNKQEPEKLDLNSMDITESKTQELLRLFPEIRTEGGKVDFDRLKLALGQTVDVGKERYGMNWPGKAECFKTIQKPSTGTLRPAPEESVNFDTTENLIIEGDNLEVLKLLQKSYAGKVKMIYIDPPYNTGNDFIYPDNYSESLQTYLEYTGQVDAGGKKFSTNTETDGRFHSKWLSMMYPRLYLARNLLSNDGAILISIDDSEMENLLVLCNEVFGEENFVANIVWQKRYTRSNNTRDMTTVVEHIVLFSRSSEFRINLLPRNEEADARYTNPDNDERGPWKGASFLNPARPEERPNLCYEIKNPNTGEVTTCTTNAWRRSEDEYNKLKADNRLYWGKDGKASIPSIKMFLSEAREITPVNFWSHEYAGSTDDGTQDLKRLIPEKPFNNPKPVLLIQRAIEHICNSTDIVLDFFAGSGTTAEAVLAKNAADSYDLKFVLVQLPEPIEGGRFRKISEISKERLRNWIAQFDDRFPQQAAPPPGFKVLKLDSSNFKQWTPEISENSGSINTQLELHVDHIVPGRTQQDILFEILLKSGFQPTVAISTLTLAGQKVFSVVNDAFLICLERNITLETIRAMAEKKPERVVCLDHSFENNDQLKANAVQIFKSQGIVFRTV